MTTMTLSDDAAKASGFTHRVSVYGHGSTELPNVTRYYTSRQQATRYANAQRRRHICALVERIGEQPARTNQHGSW